MINIVYPLIKSDSSWEEIRYSLRSVAKHFLGQRVPVQVHIIGDYKPAWLSDEVNYIPTARRKNAYEDTGHKLQVCSGMFDEFVWMHDDQYLLQDVTLQDIKRECKAVRSLDLRISPSKREYKTRKRNSYAALREIYPDKKFYDHSLHIPMFYRSAFLKKIAKQFDIFSSLIATAIYNNVLRPPHVVPRVCDSKLRIVGPGPVKPEKNHLFLNNSNEGLTPELIRFVTSLYPRQCQYEIKDDTQNVETVIKALKDGYVDVAYIGNKKNYTYGTYDFSPGWASLPRALAEKLTTGYPKTFRLG